MNSHVDKNTSNLSSNSQVNYLDQDLNLDQDQNRPRATVHDLTCWNQNKHIYHHLLQDIDDEGQFHKFDYDLISHTNLDNFFFELRQNYKQQYKQVEKLYLNNKDLIDGGEYPDQSQETQAYRDLITAKRIDPKQFEDISLQCQIRVKAGDIIDLKNCGALGYYLVYQPVNTKILYVIKTKDELGTHLPNQAWPFIEKWGWSYYCNGLREQREEISTEILITGCYLPPDIEIDRNRLQIKAPYGFLIFYPSQKSGKSHHYVINNQDYYGYIRENAPLL